MRPDLPLSDVLAALSSTDADLVTSALRELVGKLPTLGTPVGEPLGATLLELLGSPVKEVSRRAAEVFATAGPDSAAAQLLVRALRDREPRRRWGAAFALARAGRTDAAMLRVVVDSLSIVDGDVRWAAAEIVRGATKSHPRVIAWLHEAAVGPSAHARKMALYCLRDVGRADRELFVAALADDDREVRLAALSGLCEAAGAGDERTVERVLATIRDDEDAGVRRSAAAALGRIVAAGSAGGPDVRGRAIRVLDALRDDASDPHMQRAARRALGMVGVREV